MCEVSQSRVPPTPVFLKCWSTYLRTQIQVNMIPFLISVRKMNCAHHLHMYMRKCIPPLGAVHEYNCYCIHTHLLFRRHSQKFSVHNEIALRPWLLFKLLDFNHSTTLRRKRTSNIKIKIYKLKKPHAGLYHGLLLISVCLICNIKYVKISLYSHLVLELVSKNTHSFWS